MGGDAMYYGLNALSNNMILLDRKAIPLSQRPCFRYPRQRKVHELQAGDHLYHADDPG